MNNYYICSDIHAEFYKLQIALSKTGFSIDKSTDILVVVGDFLDRGSFGKETILFLEKLIDQNRLLGVLGNHDQFLLDYIDGKFKDVLFQCQYNGFYHTLQLGFLSEDIILQFNEMHLSDLEYLRNNIEKQYPKFIQFLRNLPLFLEFNHHVLVHGFLDFTISDWKHTEKNFALWEREHQQEIPTWFTKKLICGHTPNKVYYHTNEIIRKNDRILLDGASYTKDGIINIYVLNEEEI